MSGQPSQGFTLLELLVVLLILAIAAAVVTPPVVRLVESLGEREERDELMVFMQRLPVAVMASGEPVKLSATQGYVRPTSVFTGAPAQNLPQGIDQWRVALDQPIEYRVNGACTGGQLHWESAAGQQFTLRLDAPHCQPERAL